MSTSGEQLAHHFEELICRAARHLSPDMVQALERAAVEETDQTAKEVLAAILEKARVARAKGRGLTSDTGLISFFVRVGCDFPALSELDGALTSAVQAATRHEPLAPHTADLLSREDRRDNVGRGLPVIHYDVLPGSSDCRVTVLLKGAASEALTALWMLPPSTAFPEIGDRIASHVAEGGGRPCPPLVLGVGLGGTPERAVMSSRRALLRPVGDPAKEPELAEAERAWCAMVNRTGIGPMGLGGGRTVLAVHVEAMDRHRAFLPVALSVACWSDRRASLSIDRHGKVHW